MYDSQKWYQSKAVWGGILAVLAGVAGAFGYVVDESMQAEGAAIMTALAGSIGGLVAIYGRIKAEKRIK